MTSLPTSRSEHGTTRIVHDGDLVVKLATGTGAVRHLLREATVLTRLNHPNVVELLGTERGAIDARIVTAYAGRHTLADVPVSTAADVARLGAALVTVVRELHGLGWVHGGLDASHCIVDDSGRLSLCSVASAERVGPNDHRRDEDVAAALDIVGSLLARLPTTTLRSEARARAEVAAALRGRGRPSLEALAAAWDHVARSRPARSAAARQIGRRARPQPLDARRSPVLCCEETRRRVSSQHRTGGRGRARAVALAAATWLVLIGAVWALRRLGGPLGLDAATTTGPERWGDLPAPVLTVLAVVRLMAFVAAGYGLMLTTVALTAIVTRRPDIGRWATRLAPPPLRRALGALIAAGVLASTAGGRAAPMTAAADRPTTTAPPTTAAPTTAAPTTAAPTTAAPGPAPAARPSPSGALPRLHVVRPGDHLWAISETAVAAFLGRTPSEIEVRDYWVRLVDLNRDSLLDPTDADLIVPGQVIELPPIGA